MGARLGYEDYCALPADGRRYQILDGELCVTPAPALKHQRVSRNLEKILVWHVDARALGAIYHAPVDVFLGKHTIVQPDIVFVARDRASILSERGIEAAPDLVIEILSPATRRVDRTKKMRLYRAANVREYWLVDPDDETLEVFLRMDDGWRLVATGEPPELLRGSVVLPDLEIPLDVVFARD